MIERLDETIVAISSAPGRGAVGIVRLSGPRAYEIAGQIASWPSSDAKPPVRVCGDVTIDGAVFPAVFYLFRAPRSYTRQDLVEIHTIGSPPILEMIRKKLVESGAVPAQPGEFTARAFFHGAMDLVSAEGVARLIRAQSDTQLAAARRMMDGVFSGKVRALRDELAELLGLVEAGIDFAEEPIEFISPAEFTRRVRALIESLEQIRDQGASREAFDALPRILLLGPPNAGKSSLMNALSGTSRAICAAVAGTTRDILSAPVRLGWQEAILLDSAGIDESPDEVIAAARQLVLSTAGTVDLVCVVLDGATVLSPIAFEFVARVRSLGINKFVIAVNKCDLLSEEEIHKAIAELRAKAEGPVVGVSAFRGEELDELRSALGEAVGMSGVTVMGEAIMLSDRQREAVESAMDSMNRAEALACAAASTSQSADVLAFELREALDALGAVTGEVTTEDLLTQIFANFCVGK